MTVVSKREDLGSAALATVRPGVTATKIWIAVGACWFALFLYSMGTWIFGPDFVPNTTGHAQASAGYKMFIRITEFVGLALTICFFYMFVIKQWIKAGELTFDGMFFLACGALVLQEPWLNWIRPQLLYNDLYINFGCWLGNLPGIVSPVASKIPLPLGFAGIGYFYIVAGPSLAGSAFMSRIRRRNPGISAFNLVARCFLAFVIFDIVIENFILRTGMFIYPSTVPWLTLFAGKIYQFPVYEIASWAGTYTALASIHFFRNGQGETWADRGFSGINIPGPFRKFTRWLAIMGMCQVGMLVTYNIPYQFWALQGGPFTVTAEQYPWFTAGLCGTGTAYACPGPGVLVARHDSPTNRIATATATQIQP